MRLVLIEWVDSSGGSGWIPVDEIEEEPIIIRSVGWVLRETKDIIVIAAHHGQRNGRTTPEQVHSEMKIPKVAIKRVRNLREPR